MGAERELAGFSLVEVALVMTVLIGAILVLSQSLTASMRLTGVNRESALATDAARRTIEVLEGTENFGQIFALYNEDPLDDPGAPNTAPGPHFEVPGLQPVPGDEDGRVGEILFPTVDGPAGLELREDLNLPEMGLPRDLDADGDIEDTDVSDFYQLLPVVVRLRWRGQNGEVLSEARTLLADR